MKKEKIVTDVYNGYTEKFLNGSELKKLLFDSFYCAGRHHETVYDLTISEYLTSINIKEDKNYRVFINNNFCKIMNAETNVSIDFFSHTKIENPLFDKNKYDRKYNCSICGATMIVKHGKYGPFWSCTNYPLCKGSKKIFIIGNYSYSGFKACNLPHE